MEDALATGIGAINFFPERYIVFYYRMYGKANGFFRMRCRRRKKQGQAEKEDEEPWKKRYDSYLKIKPKDRMIRSVFMLCCGWGVEKSGPVMLVYLSACHFCLVGFVDCKKMKIAQLR
jgi:hypothetical protein